jgi:hypothetical protein
MPLVLLHKLDVVVVVVVDMMKALCVISLSGVQPIPEEGSGTSRTSHTCRPHLECNLCMRSATMFATVEIMYQTTHIHMTIIVLDHNRIQKLSCTLTFTAF